MFEELGKVIFKSFIIVIFFSVLIGPINHYAAATNGINYLYDSYKPYKNWYSDITFEYQFYNTAYLNTAVTHQ